MKDIPININLLFILSESTMAGKAKAKISYISVSMIKIKSLEPMLRAEDLYDCSMALFKKFRRNFFIFCLKMPRKTKKDIFLIYIIITSEK